MKRPIRIELTPDEVVDSISALEIATSAMPNVSRLDPTVEVLEALKNKLAEKLVLIKPDAKDTEPPWGI